MHAEAFHYSRVSEQHLASQYASSRVIYALALEGKAPAIFRRCTKGGVPVYAVALTALFGLLGFLCVQEGKTEDAFNWVC